MPTFIIVDDDEEDRYFIRYALHQLNSSYPVVEFANGPDFLEYLQQEFTEKGVEELRWLVAMDIQMPLMDGIDVVDMMQQHPLWRQIPVILFTSASTPDQRQDLLRLGVTACVEKPGSINELRDQLKTIFAPWLACPVLGQ